MLNVLLTSHIQKINKKHDLSDSDAFIVYCLSKILPIEEQVAKGYITDGPNDGNIDAFYFDFEEENELVSKTLKIEKRLVIPLLEHKNSALPFFNCFSKPISTREPTIILIICFKNPLPSKKIEIKSAGCKKCFFH